MKVKHGVGMDAAHNYRLCFIRSLSAVYLGVAEEAPKLEENEILEARFFNENGELRMFRGEDGTLCGVELTKESSDRCIEEAYVIDNAQFGSALTVRRILDADEDGQTYVKATCLCGWERGKTV